VRNCAPANLEIPVSRSRAPRNDWQGNNTQSNFASSVIFVFNSFDTGQPALASPASS